MLGEAEHDLNLNCCSLFCNSYPEIPVDHFLFLSFCTVMKTALLFVSVLLCLSCKQQSSTIEKKDLSSNHEEYRTDTVHNAVVEELRHCIPPDSLISWFIVQQQLNNGKLHLDSLGEFITEKDEDFILGDCIRSAFSGKQDTIVLKYINNKTVILINNESYNMIAIDGEDVSNANFSPLNIYQCNTPGGRFSFFAAGPCLCNGTLCTIITYFILHHNSKTCFTFCERTTFPDISELIVDINNDSLPDFLYPVRMSSFYNTTVWSDTCEALKVIPYTFTETSFQVNTKSDGDTLFYNLFAHYEFGYEVSRIWSHPREGKGIIFKEKGDY